MALIQRREARWRANTQACEVETRAVVPLWSSNVSQVGTFAAAEPATREADRRGS